MQRDLVTRIFRNVQAKVRGVRRAWRDQMNVNNGASGPGVALVNRIAVPIDLKRTIEVSSRLDRAFAIVFNFSAPENDLAFLICGLQLEPGIESINGATWEKVADLPSADYNIHASIAAPAHSCIGAIDGSGNRTHFAGRTFWQRNIRFFAYSESRRKFRLSDFSPRGRVRFISRRGNRENIHGELFVL